MDSIKQMIEKRAYELFLKRGGLHGYSVQDWFQAEKEIFAELEAKKTAGPKPQPKPAKEELPSAAPAPYVPAAPAAQASKPKPAGTKPSAKPPRKGKF